jgi:tRNA (mo5U34)-methyltransferase
VTVTGEERTLAAEIAAHPLWYHTLELPGGITTPGWFDLRPIVDRMPWPDVRGKRCLDVGTWDGFLAFELERRGASEVVATDISDPTQWDWPIRDRSAGPEAIAAMAGERNGRGFELAKRALGSSVERREVNVYDLSPDLVGVFDVVVCGSLMLHLRDPVRALEAVRSVCGGVFLSAEQVQADLSAVIRRRPVARYLRGENCQWWIPTAAGHRAMVESAGFRIERQTGIYAIPLGAGHRDRDLRPGGAELISRLIARGSGMAHAALVARPGG